MKVKQTAREWLDDLWNYEDKHPIAFASPRALAEARLIAELDRARRLHRRTDRNGVPPRRKAAVS
jgi:hypothetical protein